MTDSQGRALSNYRMRRFMQAVQEVTGQSGLTTILSQADLPRYAGTLPPNNRQSVLTAAQYASLIQAIENYYGRGARGTLNRIGHEVFQRVLASQPATTGLFRLTRWLLPGSTRARLVLGWAARELGNARLETQERKWILVDEHSDGTCGRARDTEICWITLGMIQAALHWA